MDLNIRTPQAVLGLGRRRDPGHPSITTAACAELLRGPRSAATSGCCHSCQGGLICPPPPPPSGQPPRGQASGHFALDNPANGCALQGGPGSRSG